MQSRLEWWEYPMWEGVTGQETAGLSQDDPKRAQFTAADWPNWAAAEFAKENPGFSAKVETLTWDEGRNKADGSGNYRCWTASPVPGGRSRHPQVRQGGRHAARRGQPRIKRTSSQGSCRQAVPTASSGTALASRQPVPAR